MNIFVCCSRSFYDKAQPIFAALEKTGHAVTPPNNFDDPGCENRIKEGKEGGDYFAWKAQMFREQEKKVEANDAIVVLNFEKEGKPNYIGGATFLEMFKAWELGKKIFLYNPIPEGILYDEIVGFNPVVIDGDVTKVI